MILLFGATGMVGQAIAAEAARRHLSLAGVARRGADRAADLADGDGLTALLECLRPALVINAGSKGAREQENSEQRTEAFGGIEM